MQLRTRDYRRTTLGPRHRPIVRALAEAFFSPDGELDAARLDALVEEVDRFMSPASKTLRFGLKVMLFVIEFSPVFFFRFRTFTAMSIPDRCEHLERLEASRVAQLPLIVVSYKTLMTMLFYDDAIELGGIGYAPERTRWRRGLPVAPEAEAEAHT